jgi:quercetin dioxygenase-like cupin family protein
VIVLDPRAIAAGAVSARPGRPATAIVHDSPDARLVVFRLAPGEAVPPHAVPSTVVLSVLEGAGTFLAPGAECPVGPGALVTYEPNELHGLRATTVPLIVLATITPGPGSR